MNRPFTTGDNQTILDLLRLWQSWYSNVPADTWGMVGPLYDQVACPPFTTFSADANNVLWGYDLVGDTLVVLVGGASRSSHTDAIVSGWLRDAVVPGPPRSTIAFVLDQATAMLATMTAAGLRGINRVHVVGYSIGGVIGECLIDLFADSFPLVPCYIVTFGSPMGWLPSASARVRSRVSRGFRLMMDDDVIPLMPVNTSLSTSIALYVGVGPRERWNSWEHAREGVQVHLGGQPEPRYQPTHVFFPTFAGVGAYYLGQNTTASSLHSASTYQTAWQGALRRGVVADTPAIVPAVANNVVPPIQGPPVVPAAVPPAVLNRQLAAAEQARRNAALGASVGDVRIPTADQVTALKVGRMYQLYWEGQLILSTPSKRHAAAVRRRLTAFATLFLSSPGGSPSGMVEAMRNFFASAQDPMGGFVPPIPPGVA